MRVFRITKAVVLASFLALSLMFNVATVAFDTVATMVSGAYEAVTGAASVLGQKNRDLEVKSRQLDAKTKRVASLSDEVADLKKPKVVSYRGKKRLLSEAVEDSAKRISRRTATGAVRNASSVVAEGIPLAGIAVVIGVTAWDLKDACDTMHDLHQLELAFNPGAALDPEATEVCGLRVPTKEEVWASVKASPGKAWAAARDVMPDLPSFSMPEVDWSFWN